MFHIALIEDEDDSLALFKTNLKRYTEKNHILFQTDVYKNAVCFLTDYEPVYNIVFMDIELPHMNGMEAAKKLREIDKDIMIIFVTNMAQYAVSGYEVEAFDFIVKPLHYMAFELKLNRAITHLKRCTTDTVNLNTQDGLVRISVSDIYYIEVIGHKLIYHTIHKDYPSRGHNSLSSVCQEFSPYHFLRCNNCYLINPIHVEKVTDTSVYIQGTPLAISRPRKKEFLADLTAFLGGKK